MPPSPFVTTVMKGMWMDSPPALAAPAQPSNAIVVTASRIPERADSTAASVSVVDAVTLARVGAPFVTDYLRLLPSTSVSISGPAGSLTEVRIRGAEANHTLLFIDGIRANDPAAGNTPRFELLNADIASRIEEVRGPQSALWGSEAIGGVIAVEGDPGARTGATLLAEAGSFATYRGSASATYAAPGLTAALAIAGQKSRGTDAFDGTGDRDGYDNKTIRGRLAWQMSPGVQIGATGFATSALSEYDGYNSDFVHADTLDNTRNHLAAGRIWAALGERESRWSGSLAASLLGSSNVNRLAQDEVNRTRASRSTITAELRRHLQVGEVDQHLVLAIEREDERFHARSPTRDDGTDQDQSRRHESVTFEWRGDWTALTGDLAVRRDAFNRFKDSTTVRASLLARLGGGFVVTGAFGGGIAQPTFYDLFGYFPGSFVGNSALRPETSQGVEGSVRWRSNNWSASVAAYSQRLRDEIIPTFNLTTFLQSTANAASVSHRKGVEAEVSYQPSPALRLHVEGSYLHATEPGAIAGVQVKETRRPVWSGALLADGARGRLSYGATLAYTGARSDLDFNSGVGVPVRLASYWLAGARVAYQLTGTTELFARVANAFDASYRDVVGYRPSGRSVNAGIRLAVGG